MQSVAYLVQLVLCVALIGLILIQHGKGAEAGATFGGGASSTVFGSQGSNNFLIKLTTWLAVAFFVNCLYLGAISRSHAPKSIMVDVANKTPKVSATTLHGQPKKVHSTKGK